METLSPILSSLFLPALASRQSKYGDVVSDSLDLVLAPPVIALAVDQRSAVASRRHVVAVAGSLAEQIQRVNAADRDGAVVCVLSLPVQKRPAVAAECAFRRGRGAIRLESVG